LVSTREGESVKSAILEKGEEFYTNMNKVFNAIGNEQLKYNWLITNCECYPKAEKLDKLFSTEYIWITGEQLTEIVGKEDFQFIWAAFSGFPEGISLEEVLKYDLPFADGYEGYWINDVGIQHPLADIEIVAWDSSLTMFISKDEDLVQKFRHTFPLSEDLSVQNTRHNSEIAHIEKLLIRELDKRNLSASEEMLNKKYLIWNRLYSKRKRVITDKDILKYIGKVLKWI